MIIVEGYVGRERETYGLSRRRDVIGVTRVRPSFVFFQVCNNIIRAKVIIDQHCHIANRII